MSSSFNDHDDEMNIRRQMQLDGKQPSTVSNLTFAGTLLFGVPLWLTTLVPMSVTYQLLWKQHLLNPPLLPNHLKTSESFEPQHSETFPEPSQLKPLSDRSYDVVLLGATGFTGALAAKYMATTYHKNNNNNSNPSIRWALAGRNVQKLQSLKEHLAQVLQLDSLLRIPLLVVDTSDPSTLHALVQDTKTVISTAGPFCKYGTSVVEFCARYGTSYVDITGEIGWNKEMMIRWEHVAQATGAILVSFCGCDSIPWDLTYHHLSRLLKNSCHEDIVKLQIDDELKGGISGGTIDTMLQFMEGNYKEQRNSTIDPYYKKPSGEISYNRSQDYGPMFLRKRKCRTDASSSSPSRFRWTIPWFMSTINYQVIKRSHALNDQIQNGTRLTYEEYWLHDSFQDAFVTWFGTIFSITALLNPISGYLMKTFVLPKPGQGPTSQEMDHGYLLVSGKGKGSNGSQVESTFYFPADPGYKETARMVVEAGLCLALHRDILSVKSGGFYSPSVAMGDILLDRLCKTGCKFTSRVVVNMNSKGNTKLQSKL